MGVRGLAETARIWRLMVRHAVSRLALRLRAAVTSPFSGFRAAATGLLIAPQDIRTADPTLASDIYAGLFVFSGQIVEVNGHGPFGVIPPDEDWARVLHGFSWLRHLRAADTALARSNARALVEDWIRVQRHLPPIAFRPDVVARRVMSFLSHAPLILDAADPEFTQRFLKCLSGQVKLLATTAPLAPDGLPRLQAALALLAASISVAGLPPRARLSAQAMVDRELLRQILPDGGHVSRSPEAILDILIDLLPIRQALAVRNVPPSQTMMNAVDRMMPMLRFFRHGDGAFACFNGTGNPAAGILATVLAYDDTGGATLRAAPHSGYQRLEAGGTLVLVETGPPPPPGLSTEAHAGCLSFEFSSRRQRIVVNCGAPPPGRREWRAVARRTAAHSTVVIEDTSSADILGPGRAEHILGPVLLSGPHQVTVERPDSADGDEMMTARHDGYAARFGLVHERMIAVEATGGRVDGRDRFLPAGSGPKPGLDGFTIRFHLHPQVRASTVRSGTAAILVTGDGESWTFTAPGHEITLEESVHLASAQGPRRTLQIVISGAATLVPEVAWSFVRDPQSRGRRRPPLDLLKA